MSKPSLVRFALLFVLVIAVTSAAYPQGTAPDTTPQVVTMTAKKYDFDPPVVTVTKGRRVRIEATALDRDHGIEIKELGVKVKLVKGKMTPIEFTPDKAGEFELHCSVFCGLGHHGMKGKLVVVEPTNP
jgi:cytochrome c oxidase subunit II